MTNPLSELPRRPLSPRLSIYRWQPAMIASIAHRASGILLFLFAPLYLWVVHHMTGSAEDFALAYNFLHSLPGVLLLWLVGSSLIYHFLNGIRFLSLDIGWGESRETMRGSARIVLVLSVLLAVLLAVLL